MLTSIKHPNIVTLIGFCVEDTEMILVTENVSNGYLWNYLGNNNDMRILTWEKRLKICIEVANALEHLHYEMEDQKMIIHRDICSYNIGLDENWRAKIDGFGDWVFLPPNQEDEAVYPKSRIGRKYNKDPQYEKTGKLKRESDVYSFGIVLLEILCGRAANDPIYRKESDKGLGPVARQSFCTGTLEDMIDPILKEETSEYNSVLKRGPNKESLHTFMKIAHQCVAETQDQRPTMKVVVKELEKALSFQENKFGHLKIRLGDIKLATNNFSETYTIASVDGECTLYRAELHCLDKENPSSEKGKNKGDHPKAHNIVLIKRYPSGNECYEVEEFFTEIEMLTSIKHPNTVTLIGFCVEDSEMILVTENVSNGYLDDYLRNDNDMRILTWDKRLKICIEVANALEHLHSEMEDQKMIIHRDICSCNIGLDENWRAKIDGFGDCVFLPPNQKDEAVYIEWRGRSCYIDPEYEKTDKLKRESDVYSFGIVLLEILCGRAADDPIYLKESEKGLGPVARQSFCTGTLEDMIDPILKKETSECNFVLKRGPNKESLHTFMKIAYQCVAETQDQRPTMKVVVKELEKALSFQLNSEVKFDYVEEKSHASVIETQVVELSNELNSMNMTDKSESFEIHNKENMLHDQTDDPAEPDC